MTKNKQYTDTVYFKIIKVLFKAYELWFKQILFEVDSVRDLFMGKETVEVRMGPKNAIYIAFLKKFRSTSVPRTSPAGWTLPLPPPPPPSTQPPPPQASPPPWGRSWQSERDIHRISTKRKQEQTLFKDLRNRHGFCPFGETMHTRRKIERKPLWDPTPKCIHRAEVNSEGNRLRVEDPGSRSEENL